MKYLVACFFSFFSFITFSQEDYAVYNIPLELRKNANCLILYKNIDVDVSKSKSLYIKSKSAITVFNKLGDDAVQYYLGYDLDTKIKKINAYVYDANGYLIKHYKRKDFQDVSAISSISLYEDDRVLYLNFNPSSYPYTFVFEYETQSNTTAFLPPFMPINYSTQSVKNSTYTITFNSENKPRYKVENLDAYNISISEKPNQIICNAKNIEAIEYEELSPSYDSFLPKITFALNHFSLKGVNGYASNWEEFGIWMQKELLADIRELPEGTIQEIKNLTNQANNNIEKAKIVYQYLQQKVRYISVQMGIGGWKPMLAKDVDRLSYGDCKALTNYTKALLDAIDVPNYYTIIYAGGGRKAKNITKDFAVMQGNHAILGVPDGNDIVWLECTDQDIPFGYMGNFTDDRDALIITPEGGKIVHTKVYTYKDNTQDTKVKIDLKSDGSLKAYYNRVYKGQQYDGKYRYNLLKPDELKKSYLNKWNYLNGYRVENINLKDDKENIIFTENLNIIIDSYCSKIGNDLLFCPNLFNREQYRPPRVNYRKQELFLSQGHYDTDELEINLPFGYHVDELPKEENIENKFGAYSISFHLISENKLIYKRKFYLKKGNYPPEDYVIFRDFLIKIIKLDNKNLLLKKSN